MFKPPHEVVGVTPGYESSRVVRLPQEHQHSVSISQGSLSVACILSRHLMDFILPKLTPSLSVRIYGNLVVMTAKLGLGSQSQDVGIVHYNGTGTVQVPQSCPGLLNLP